jgi:hypothetical protein
MKILFVSTILLSNVTACKYYRVVSGSTSEPEIRLTGKRASDCIAIPQEFSESVRIGRVNALTLFGLFAVTAMLVTYALENCSAWFVLAFAVSCALGSVYGFLQGAWPFGVVEAIWAIVAVRRWYTARQ